MGCKKIFVYTIFVVSRRLPCASLLLPIIVDIKCSFWPFKIKLMH